MKSLQEYILNESEGEERPELERGEIKFDIWESPDKRVTYLKNNKAFQKIEYKHIDKEKGIEIDFLMGMRDNTWRLWIGKIGACSYDDDAYCNFKTDNFKEAMVACIDKVEEFIKKVEDDPDNYIQYYIHR